MLASRLNQMVVPSVLCRFFKKSTQDWFHRIARDRIVPQEHAIIPAMIADRQPETVTSHVTQRLLRCSRSQENRRVPHVVANDSDLFLVPNPATLDHCLCAALR